MKKKGTHPIVKAGSTKKMKPYQDFLLKVCKSFNDQYACICFTILLHSDIPLTEEHIIETTKLQERKVRIALQLLLSHALVCRHDTCIEDICSRTWYVSYTRALNSILYRAMIYTASREDDEMICPMCHRTWSIQDIALLQFKCPDDSCDVVEHIDTRSKDVSAILSELDHLDRQIGPNV